MRIGADREGGERNDGQQISGRRQVMDRQVSFLSRCQRDDDVRIQKPLIRVYQFAARDLYPLKGFGIGMDIAHRVGQAAWRYAASARLQRLFRQHYYILLLRQDRAGRIRQGLCRHGGRWVGDLRIGSARQHKRQNQ